MINVVEMWWDLELEKMMSNIKCSLHQQWLGAAVCGPCCWCRQRAGTNICQMVYQDINVKICLSVSLFDWKENKVYKQHIHQDQNNFLKN